MKEYRNDRGCIVLYNYSPLKLANDDEVKFRIVDVCQPEGVDDDEMTSFLKDFENEINWILIKEYGIERMDGKYPHFYIPCPYSDNMDLLIRVLGLSYVDDYKIMLYPPNDDFKFHGSWQEYFEMKKARNDNILVVNAVGSVAEGSMIDFWQDYVHFAFSSHPYVCPATFISADISQLDGAHVEIVGHPEMGQYITPVINSFNRSHSRRSFYVKPKYLVKIT